MRQPPENAPFVSAVILAAGRSSRMPVRNKLALDIEGQPMLLRVIKNLQNGGVEDVVVVIGHAADELDFLPKNALHIVENHDYQTGMASSIRCGIQQVSKDADAAMIVLGDMPFIAPATIRLLCKSARDLRELAIFRPNYRGQSGHPVLFSRHFFPELMRLSGDRGALAIIKKNQSMLREIDCDDAGVLIDIDTPDALQKLKGDVRESHKI